MKIKNLSIKDREIIGFHEWVDGGRRVLIIYTTFHEIVLRPDEYTDKRFTSDDYNKAVKDLKKLLEEEI